MIKSVNIDGKDYIIRSCGECPLYEWGDDAHRPYCKYPCNNRGLIADKDGIIPDDCPLGLVKDCCTCKYEGRLDKSEKPCIDCTVSIGPGMEESTPPTRWKVKE